MDPIEKYSEPSLDSPDRSLRYVQGCMAVWEAEVFELDMIANPCLGRLVEIDLYFAQGIKMLLRDWSMSIIEQSA